jgi:hypothetical protein
MVVSARRWTVLAVGTFAQAATCCFVYGLPMLLPQRWRPASYCSE